MPKRKTTLSRNTLDAKRMQVNREKKKRNENETCLNQDNELERKRLRSTQQMRRLEEQRQRTARNKEQSRNAFGMRAALAYQPEIDYENMKEISIGKMEKICRHCNARKWSEESPGLCCFGELPDKERDPLLYAIVCKNMIHGPCGEHNTASSCMKNNRCLKRYPRNFIVETQTGNDGYPTYRRRSLENGGYIANLNIRGKIVRIDNRWIVPYCPMLTRCLQAHINVEYCHSVQAIKYICKYINKGSDQATFTVQNKMDEVKKYLNGRYISTSEACWRFFDFSIHERYPTVMHLAVHLENGQRVYFTENNIQEVIENPRKTTLIAFFDLCKTDEFAKTLLYHEVPGYYTWNNNTFMRRKRGQDVEGHPGIKKDSALGRIYTIHPNQTECFYLRMLLHHVRGPTSFEVLRTVNGVVNPTFKAACQERGLLENDDQWKNTLADAVELQSSRGLRELFAIILVFCQPSRPVILWETFKLNLCEDILYKERCRYNDTTLTLSDDISNKGLIKIEDEVVRLRCSYDTNELEEYVRNNLQKLVIDQKMAFDRIMDSVNNNLGKVLFLDAPGGTGKTFLLNLIMANGTFGRHYQLFQEEQEQIL
ncbi:uncharacterized protein [Temnothorax nylanderi]|uniref:uncharacterized protein n=1 Tax=Temnothorax nylanderi TaxID=102681 RepID=UPI003A85C862